MSAADYASQIAALSAQLRKARASSATAEIAADPRSVDIIENPPNTVSFGVCDTLGPGGRDVTIVEIDWSTLHGFAVHVSDYDGLPKENSRTPWPRRSLARVEFYGERCDFAALRYALAWLDAYPGTPPSGGAA